MQERIKEFERLGAQVVVISFVKPDRLKQYLGRRAWTMRVLSDPELKAYHAFGLERASWLRMLRPRALLVYMQLILRGKMPQRPQEDVHQLGGDFILDPSGRVIYEYRSEDPTDRPTPTELLEVLASRAETSRGERAPRDR